jgi:hypothetical protein
MDDLRLTLGITEALPRLDQASRRNASFDSGNSRGGIAVDDRT